MELHKMEYKLKNLKQRYHQIKKEKTSLENSISELENKMQKIMDKASAGFHQVKGDGKPAKTTGSKLRY